MSSSISLLTRGTHLIVTLDDRTLILDNTLEGWTQARNICHAREHGLTGIGTAGSPTKHQIQTGEIIKAWLDAGNFIKKPTKRTGARAPASPVAPPLTLSDL